jgi:biotin carboxyl carrier protein
VNQSLQAIRYSQAVLWSAAAGRVIAVSGVPAVEQSSPYVKWLNALLPRWNGIDGPLQVTAHDAGAQETDWADWFPAYALVLPMRRPDSKPGHLLLLAQEGPWDDRDVQIGAMLARSYGAALNLSSWRRPRSLRSHVSLRRTLIGCAAVAVCAAGAIPIRSNVLAPADVVPEHPVIIRAPYQGVVSSVGVSFNATVKTGDVLVTMDSRQAVSQRDEARKAAEAARLEMDEASQAAMADPKARAQVDVLRARLGEQEADLAYRETLVDRSEVRSPASGVAVIGDPLEWGGKPVEAGERILLVASPESGMVEITVPASDGVTFNTGSPVLFFDNLRPDHPVHGLVVFSSYGTTPDADGILSYRLRAQLDPGSHVRLGTRGTAKVFGGRRPLAAWIFRRPLNAVRQWLAG